MNERSIIATTRRENGDIETTDMTKRFLSMNKEIAAKIRKGTAAAGRGEVLEIVYSHTTTNLQSMVKIYNNVNNEGFEGFIPPKEYFMKLKGYKETENREAF